jgi:hypothetical protein
LVEIHERQSLKERQILYDMKRPGISWCDFERLQKELEELSKGPKTLEDIFAL